MNERAVVFGARQTLWGLVTEPSAERSARRTAVILLNAGLIHRIGPNRMYVRFARELARQGFWVLRFDLSGTGDSAPRPDDVAFDAGATQDTIEAMDYLAATGEVDDFLLVGLCSGADMAFSTATRDPRVRGACLIDFLYVPTLRYYLSCYGKLVFSFRRWRRLVGGDSQMWPRLWKAVGGLFSRRPPGQQEVWDPSRVETLASKGLTALAEHGTELCMVFTADGPSWHHYRRCFRKALGGPGKERVQVEVFHDTDHVFTSVSSQLDLLDVIQGWACRVSPERHLSRVD